MSVTTYWRGDLAQYTGKSKTLHGGLFYELKLLEGHRRTETVWTQTAPKLVVHIDAAGNVSDEPAARDLGLFNVVWVNLRNGKRGKLNAAPMTHHEAVTFLSKQTKYDWRQDMLEPVTAPKKQRKSPK